jgi:hypothetical protein
MPQTVRHGWVALGLSATGISTSRWLVWKAWTDRKRCFGMGVWRCCGVRFYPCQLFTPFSVWTAQKRTRLVAVDSASAPTRIARRIEACGIVAPPRCVIVDFCIVVVMCDHSGRQPALLMSFRRARLCTAPAYGHHLLSRYGYLLTCLGTFCVNLGSRPARHGTPLSAGNTQATPIALASF